uniref:Uncharacterized protein n=1 Tax=Oryza rufipogon TaxID=4529 RepID=A0A0E0NI46_ORYRU
MRKAAAAAAAAANSLFLVVVVVSPPSVWWCKLRWNRHTALAFLGGEERRGAGESLALLLSSFVVRLLSRLWEAGPPLFWASPLERAKVDAHQFKGGRDRAKRGNRAERHHLPPHALPSLPQCTRAPVYSPPPPLPLQGHAKNLRARLLRFHTARVSGAFREQSLDGTLGYFGGFIELWMPNSPMLHQNGSVTGATKVLSLKKKGEHRISSGMQMSTNPNHYPVFPHSFCNQHVVSFQTSTIANGSGAIPVCPASSGGMNSDMTLLNTTPSTIVSTSSPNMLADSNQSLKYAAPMAVDWSYPELQLLNDGLLKYANEPGIMKYIKIAAMLPEKTVRDVAMRCQWMAADKMVESSWATNRQVQTTDIRSPSTLACNTVRDNQFQSGGWFRTILIYSIMQEGTSVIFYKGTSFRQQPFEELREW